MPRTRTLLVSLLAAVGLAGCAGTQAADVPLSGGQAGADVEVTVIPDGSTELRAGARVQTLRGRFEHARVAPALPADGRSLSGDRLVLQDMDNATNNSVSRFAVVDATLSEPARMVDLNGDFDYDAVSPTLDTLYLIHRFSAERPDNYHVRAFNVTTGTLDDGPIADKTKQAEGPMLGHPIARATTASGEWVYTAYRGDHPFVHALNAVEKYAICVDLPHAVAHVEDWELTLDEPAQTLTATSPATGLTVKVDVKGFAASLV